MRAATPTGIARTTRSWSNASQGTPLGFTAERGAGGRQPILASAARSWATLPRGSTTSASRRPPPPSCRSRSRQGKDPPAIKIPKVFENSRYERGRFCLEALHVPDHPDHHLHRWTDRPGGSRRDPRAPPGCGDGDAAMAAALLARPGLLRYPPLQGRVDVPPAFVDRGLPPATSWWGSTLRPSTSTSGTGDRRHMKALPWVPINLWSAGSRGRPPRPATILISPAGAGNRCPISSAAARRIPSFPVNIATLIGTHGATWRETGDSVHAMKHPPSHQPHQADSAGGRLAGPDARRLLGRFPGPDRDGRRRRQRVGRPRRAGADPTSTAPAARAAAASAAGRRGRFRSPGSGGSGSSTGGRDRQRRLRRGQSGQPAAPARVAAARAARPATDARPAEAGNPGSDPLPPNPPETGVIPVLWITVGQAIPRDSKVDGRMKVIEDHDGTLTGIESRPAKHDVRIGIEIRGQSSFNYDQKPYGFEIRDEMGNGLAIPLLGMPQEPDFILHSCYADKTCMRNALTYALGRELGEATNRWTPRTRWVEVYVDGQYKGLYLLVERIKRDRARVQMPPPAADMSMGDITRRLHHLAGGRRRPPGRGLERPLRPSPPLRLPLPQTRRHHPRPEDVHPAEPARRCSAPLEQDPHLSPAILQTHRRRQLDRLHAAAGADQQRRHLLEELVPAQAARGRRRQVLRMGPLWDFDIAYGNVIFKKRYCANTWAHTEIRAPMTALWRGQGAAGRAPLPLEQLARRRRPAGHRPHRGEARRLGQTHRHRQGPRRQAVEEHRPVGLAQQLHRRLAGPTRSPTCATGCASAWPGWTPTSAAAAPRCPRRPRCRSIAAPPYVRPRNMREPYLGRDAPDYVPIEGNVGGSLASWACPR